MCVGRNGAQKLLGVLITIGEAVAYVVSGMYGDVRDLGSWNAILIITQVGGFAVGRDEDWGEVLFGCEVDVMCGVCAAVHCWYHCYMS